jgi:hypothetical protein
VIGKNLWLYKTLNTIETEIVGPTSLRDQELLIDIFQKLACEIVYIDGSIDRTSICLSEKIDEIVLVAGASAGDTEEIHKKLSGLKKQAAMPIFQLPAMKEHFAHPRIKKLGGNENYISDEKKSLSIYNFENITYSDNDIIKGTQLSSIYGNENAIIAIIENIISSTDSWIYFPGALTDFSYNLLKSTFFKFRGKLVFDHPLNLRIVSEDLLYLLEKKVVYTRKGFNLNSIAINSYSPKHEHIDVDRLRNHVKKMFNNEMVIDVMEVF